MFGVVFLSLMLTLSINFPNPTAFQLKSFITALSLSAAGIGAVLPGTLEIRYKTGVRAGGALALFVIVWFSKPAIEQSVVSLKEPTQKSDVAIAQFLSELDAGDTSKTYSDLDIDRQGQASLETWQELYDSNIKPLGKMLGRRLVNVDGGKSPPNLPVGIYRSQTYLTKYAAIHGCRIENVVVKAAPDDRWRVYSYQVAPTDMPCPPGL